MDLPSPIRAYFEANARLDADAMLAPFSSGAIVRDEGHRLEGAEEIRRWLEQSTIAVRAVAAPQAIRSDGARHTVEAEVSGDFPGSPLVLTFDFALANDSIAALEIG